MWRQHKALLRRTQLCNALQRRAEAPDLDPQSRAMRLIGVPGAKAAGEQRAPRQVPGPRLGQGAGQREQHWTRGERNDRAGFAHGVAFNGSLPATGLTDPGRQLVHECDQLGIILDVSHINSAGFWDMLAESRNPIVATHSSVKAISPHVRNLDDGQIKALASKGGTIGINFANIFLRPDMQANPDTALDVIVSHFDHIVNLVGDEHVSFGTDFDGTDIPAVVGDAAGLPLILRALKAEGYSDTSLERICHGNFLRVAGAVWKDA